MKEKWSQRYENKKIVILGYGMEGQSTYSFLKHNVKECQLQIMDRNASYVKSLFQDSDEKPLIYDEDQYLNIEDDVAMIFKSPGIPLKDLEAHLDMSIITSQSNEFIEMFRDKIIGITGTKGKSTTATLTYELLAAEGMKVELVGNIGKPAFDYITEGETPYYVYELSSHQLETVKVSPKYGVVLNIFEEHLDHYHSFDHYAEAKMNIGRFQKGEDMFIYSALSEECPNRVHGFLGKGFTISNENSLDNGIIVNDEAVTLKFNGQSTVLESKMKRHILGNHNLIIIGVAVFLTQMIGCDSSEVRLKTIASFKGLHHRLCYVTTINEVHYYNDSISTIPQATIAAIKALNQVDSVIIGGMDRGVDYDLLIDYINNQPSLKVILLPLTGHKIVSSLLNEDRLFVVKDMSEAVEVANQQTAKGRICLLSPAAASYGYYKNFEERGRHFEDLVHGLL